MYKHQDKIVQNWILDYWCVYIELSKTEKEKTMPRKNTLNEDIIDEELEDLEDFDFFDEEEETPAERKNRLLKQACYEIVHYTKLGENEKPLEKVIGHENQKKELLAVVDWFKRSKELKARGVSVPKGILLFGKPGNGKSLFIKEIIRCIDAPVFILRGDQDNVVHGIVEIFERARKAGHAVVVIDELDLLINKERRVIRALQECLDGIESSDDILVLTATNSIGEIAGALTRNGRLEKIISVPYPTGEEALTLLKKHFKEFNLEFPEDFDEEEVALSLNGISCAGVKAVVNDIVLRNGFENITSEMIFNSIYNITDTVKEGEEEDNLSVSIHEAGHACMAHAFPEYFLINRISIKGASGVFHAKEVTKDFWPYDKIIADIKVSMAGLIAQKVICGTGSRGCTEDLQRARIFAYNMFTQCGYSSAWETLPPVQAGSRMETAVKRRNMEKKIEKLLKKCEKDTTRYVKKHTNEIKALGQLLYEKKHLKSSEIIAVIGQNQNSVQISK